MYVNGLYLSLVSLEITALGKNHMCRYYYLAMQRRAAEVREKESEDGRRKEVGESDAKLATTWYEAQLTDSLILWSIY